jgi:hypothetical protein
MIVAHENEAHTRKFYDRDSWIYSGSELKGSVEIWT